MSKVIDVIMIGAGLALCHRLGPGPGFWYDFGMAGVAIGLYCLLWVNKE